MGITCSRSPTIHPHVQRVAEHVPTPDPASQDAPTLLFSDSGLLRFEEERRQAQEAAKHQEIEAERVAQQRVVEEAEAQKRQEADWKAFEVEQAAEQAKLVADLKSGEVKENVLTLAPAPADAEDDIEELTLT
eukprot:EG_transcript_32577